MSAEETPLALESLGGGPPPPDLAGDLRRLLRLTKAGLEQLWQVLAPCLADKLSEDTETLLDIFCSAHGISSDDLGKAIKAARFLIHAAARIDLPRERFASDLLLLCPDAPVLSEVLAIGYDPSKKAIRQELAIHALMAHGKLLYAAEWRIDTIETSQKGGRIKLPVTLVTLHYRDGQEVGRVTVQVLPDMMKQLKEMCDTVLS